MDHALSLEKQPAYQQFTLADFYGPILKKGVGRLDLDKPDYEYIEHTEPEFTQNKYKCSSL